MQLLLLISDNPSIAEPPSIPNVTTNDSYICLTANSDPRLPIQSFTVNITDGVSDIIPSPLSGTHNVLELPLCLPLYNNTGDPKVCPP